MTNAGEVINPETALLHSAVYAAVNIIADTIALLPRKIMRKDKKGDFVDSKHPLFYFLETEPSPYYTWYSLMHAWINNALRWGNGYIKIHRNGIGRVVRLQLLEHHECTPWFQKVSGNEDLWYYVHGQMIPPRDILHITCLGNDGVLGKSPITLARESIGLGLAASRTMANFYKTGLKSKAVFSTVENLTDESFDHLKKQIKGSVQEDFFLLEGGTTATSLQMSPADAETLSTRKFQIEDIARMYRVPLSKLGISDKTSVGNSLSEQNIDFETDCILPWAERIEQELNRKLLLSTERIECYFNLDERHLRRMDSTKRVDYFHKRWLTGSMTSNEIRLKEGEQILENELMNTPFAQSGTLPMNKEFWKNVKLDNNTKKNENAGE